MSGRAMVMVLALGAVGLLGCDGPSRGTVSSEIAERIEGGIPLTWAGGIRLGGGEVRVTNVEVLKIGERQVDAKDPNKAWWPVKARVSYEFQHGLGEKAWKKGDKEGEFRLSKDEYGEWQAQLR